MPETRTRPDFNRQPMLWLGIAFAVGILLARAVNVDLLSSLAVIIGFGLAAFLFQKHDVAVYLILASFAVAGLASAAIENRSVSADRIRTLYDSGTIHSGDPVEVEGVLSGRPEPSVDGAFLTLRAENLIYRGKDIAVSGNVRLFITESRSADAADSDIAGLKYGSRLRVACKLDRDDAYLNPGVIPKKEILDRQRIDATGSVKSTLMIEKLADESVFLPLAWVYDQRARLIDAFRANLSPRTAGVMIASLLGDKYFLDKDTADLFRDGGTFHILVISGLHITFIGGLLLLFLRQLTPNRWMHFVITTAFLWAYTLAVGADVPVVRAATMFTVVLFSYVLYRQVALLNSLGICAVVLLVWRPSDLFDPSYQLTFVSVAAIVVMAYPLVDTLKRIGTWTPTAVEPFPPNVPIWLKRSCETLYWNAEAWAIESKRQIWSARIIKSPYFSAKLVGGMQRSARFLFEGTLVSMIVQIWMLPLSVVYFHRVSVSSIILNIWVGIFIALESFAAVAGAVISAVSGLFASPFFAIAELSDRLMLLLPEMFSDNGLASFRLPAYSGGGRAIYFIYALPIIVIAIAVNKWRPFDLTGRSAWLGRSVMFVATGALLVFISIIVLHPLSAPRADGRLHFDFLDVGQGDSALVTFPDGTTLLVDGGGRINYKKAGAEGEPFVPDTRGIGEAVVSEFLWYRGYSRIDHILATHADADHIQGLGDVAKNFRIGSAAFGRMPMDDPDYTEVADILRRRGIPSEIVARGETMRFGEVTVQVLYPPGVDDPNSIYDNNHSIVLRIVYRNRTFLMTGDIERQAESDLLAGGESLAADVVKVPHHGSRTSSTQPFIDAVKPKYAIISVGRTSPFGHPHAEVVDRWTAAGVRVLTTGTAGTISVSTDGSDLVVDSFAK